MSEAYTKILELLPKISKEEQFQLKLRLDFLTLERTGKIQLDLSNEETLYNAITKYCGGIGLFLLRKQNPRGIYDRFQSCIKQLNDIAIKFNLNSHESRGFYNLVVELAVIRLQQYKNTVSFHSIINTMGDIWNLIQVSYPGYGDNPDFFHNFILPHLK